MKKVLSTLFVTIAAVLFLEPSQIVLSKFLLLETPTEHKVRRGDWLSKIANEYYNDPTYWRELALVNRAPKGDNIYPGERVIVPSFEVIKEIRNAQSLSRVNELIAQQQDRMAPEPAMLHNSDSESAPSAGSKIALYNSQSAMASAPFMEEEFAEVERPSNLNYALMAAVAGLALLLIGGIYFYIRKRNSEVVEVYGHKAEPIEQIEAGRSVYLDGYEDEAGQKVGRKKREFETV